MSIFEVKYFSFSLSKLFYSVFDELYFLFVLLERVNVYFSTVVTQTWSMCVIKSRIRVKMNKTVSYTHLTLPTILLV